MKRERIGIIVVIIILASLIGTFFYATNNDIRYGILIINRDIPVGNNITLNYEIKKGIFAPSVSDVCLDIWVFHLNDTALQHGLLHYYIPIYGLNRYGRIKDHVVISAHYLDPGEYVVCADIVYRTDRDHCKQLEMEFKIYGM